MSDKLIDVLAGIEDIIMDKVGGHVLRSGHDGSFTAAGAQVARLIDEHANAERADAKREALREAADYAAENLGAYDDNGAIMTRDGKKFYQRGISQWLRARATAL